MTKIYKVLVSKTIGEEWRVEAESEEDARKNYWKGEKIDDKSFDIYPEEAELISNDLECLVCGYDAHLEVDTLICQHCGTSTSIKEHRKELEEEKKWYKEKGMKFH